MLGTIYAIKGLQMRSIFKGLVVATALATLASAPARADVVQLITDGGGWNVFSFLGPGSPFSVGDGDPTQLDFAFILSHPDVLRITDGYQGGDQFQLTINGTVEPPTSDAMMGFGFVGDCWTCAFFDTSFGNQYTHGSYILPAGSYFLTGIALHSPQGDGAGALELGAIPEPSTWAMMLTGFAGLGAALRFARRRTAIA
jgi:hypothetical protein